MKAATPVLPSISSVPLFVYGTLLSPVVMESLIQRRVMGRPGRLLPSSYVPSSSTATSTSIAVPESNHNLRYDYSRHPVRNAVYPGLVNWNARNEDESPNQPRNHVCGLLYTNLTDTEMDQLDDFEGDQYTKELCYVQIQQHPAPDDNNSNFDETIVGPDDVVQAMVYVWSYPLSDLDLSTDWSYATFEEKRLATYI